MRNTPALKLTRRSRKNIHSCQAVLPRGRWLPRYVTRLPLLIVLAALLALAVSGCGAVNVDWATPQGDSPTATSSDEIQSVLDSYASALVQKDTAKFSASIDPASPEFLAQQQQMYERLAAVPFDQYKVEVSSETETAPGTVIAKVNTSFTYQGSFTDLPDPERSAFLMVRKDDGWKIAGDVTAQALGKNRIAHLEDFGPVEALTSEDVIVLFHPGERAVAESALDKAQAAVPKLKSTLSLLDLPRVPVRVFDSKEQIDLAFPGQWQDWAGGAARPLGSSPGQGGEIIIDAALFTDTSGSNPDYNSTMLAHELTHVALFPRQGGRTPPFLVEGLADYVAGIPPVTVIPEKLRRNEAMSPQLSDLYQPGGFSALLTTEAATIAYEEAGTAVAYLEETYGNEKVMALLEEFAHRSDEATPQPQLVDEIFNSVLGVGWNEFEQGWRNYVIGGGP